MRLRLTEAQLFGSEDEFQARVAKLLGYLFAGKPVTWTHFPAGGYLLSKAAKARLWRLGLKPGFPDLLIMWKPGRMLWLELKMQRGVLNKAQRAMRDTFVELDIPWAVCRREEDVIAALQEHRVPMNRVALQGSRFDPDSVQPRLGGEINAKTIDSGAARRGSA